MGEEPGGRRRKQEEPPLKEIKPPNTHIQILTEKQERQKSNGERERKDRPA